MAGIDLNADLGEGFGVWRLGDDDAMLAIVTSANVASGFHAGDPAGLLRVCRSAAERGVRIGAQVSYRDLAGFGRRFIDVATEAGPKASWYPVAKPAPCWRIRRRSPTAS